jgi:uncharacterized membrane protein
LAYGQFESAEVLGTVRDTSGAIVAGATVTLTNLETGIQSQGASDASGDYDFFNVKVGRYSLAVEKTGFEKFTTKDVRVDVNARQRVYAALQVGAVTQSVEVTGAAATLDTDSSEHGEVVNTQQIVDLPLNGRNYSDLALLTTNVHRSIYAYAVPPREGAFNVNGMRSTYNSFLLDGVDNNAYSTSNQVVYLVQVPHQLRASPGIRFRLLRGQRAEHLRPVQRAQSLQPGCEVHQHYELCL